MKRSYANAYAGLYRTHWWWRAREAFILRALHDLRRTVVGGRWAILDVGCGDGLFFERLSELGDVQGVEKDELIVSPGGPFRERIHVGPFDETFVPGRRFDLILLLDVLEHLPAPRRALEQAAGLLREEGRLVLTVPAFKRLWTRHDDLNLHRTRYTRRSLRALALEAGLQVVQSSYFFHWTVPVKLAIRTAERLLGVKSGVARVPPAFLNRAAYGITRLEQRLVTPLAPPFGSSLLAVLRRA
jgi:2-polyprenyl-3-methyl-5-hydroxy-6-metoxy-1,4-benzoquinol methylase